ncbi:6860_t:CDS:2, partial [Gigaspora rosea]
MPNSEKVYSVKLESYFQKLSTHIMSLLPIDIDVIFGINEESDIEISDHELDETIDRIMDTMD